MQKSAAVLANTVEENAWMALSIREQHQQSRRHLAEKTGDRYQLHGRQVGVAVVDTQRLFHYYLLRKIYGERPNGHKGRK